MGVQQRGNRFRATTSRHGVRLSKTFATEAAASEWAARTKKKMARGWLPDDVHVRRAIQTREYIVPAEYDHIALSEPQIVSMSSLDDPICGIYFLILGDKVVYVGQSSDVHARVASHRQRKQVPNRYFMFDRIAVIRCDPPELDILEGIYISRLKPQYNGCGRALLPAAEA